LGSFSSLLVRGEKVGPWEESCYDEVYGSEKVPVSGFGERIEWFLADPDRGKALNA